MPVTSVTKLLTRLPGAACVARIAPGLISCFVLAVLVGGCSNDLASTHIPEGPPVSAAEHVAEVEEWVAQRHDELLQPDGWLSLVGLMWLDEGESSFGADSANDLVYTSSGTPAKVGVFFVDSETVYFEPAPGLEINTTDGEPVTGSLVMRAPRVDGEEADPFPVLTWGSLRWNVIERQDRFAVRLKDARSPVLLDFEQIERFPIGRAWRLDALFEPYPEPKPIMIPNILGTISEGESPGAVVFIVGGEIYRLDTWKDSDDPGSFFTAFGDLTNRDSTYGGGPDENGYTVVDFNRAYNPPCVFTPYATCPLPPAQNRLPVAIEAGEKIYKPRS